MCDIDWSKLYQATSKENRPTPGYVFNDIIQNVSYADPRHIPSVAEYLTDCVDGDHAHVKLKALFVIKALAYRVPPFCQSMQQYLASIKEAAAFTGPPSALFGDEPYRLVREAAEGAVSALTGGEHYHEQYRQMSQRIVGFGNFQPADDTVLPDGSVNVGRDIGVTDVAMGAVGLLSTGVGAIFGGVKDLIASPFAAKKGGLGALGTEVEDEEGDVPYDDNDEVPEPDEPQGITDADGCYHPSSGSYVPPCVPLAPEVPVEDGDNVDTIRDLWDDEEPDYWPQEMAKFRAEQESSASAFTDVLGLDEEQPPPAPAEQLEPSEAEIMDILGLSGSAAPTAAGEPRAPLETPGLPAAAEALKEEPPEELPFFLQPQHLAKSTVQGRAVVTEEGFVEV